MFPTHDELITRILRRAAKLRLRVRRKSTGIDLDSLSRTTNIHLAPSEWGAGPTQRGVMLEVSYGPEHVAASTADRPGAAKREVRPVDVVAVFTLLTYDGVPLEQYEERVFALFEILSKAFKQTLSVEYSVTTNYIDPLKAGAARVGVRFQLLPVGRSCVGFLDQVADAIRRLGPGGQLHRPRGVATPDAPHLRIVPSARGDKARRTSR